MNDESIMPFGQHKGKPMVEVPDDYLIWFWGENKAGYKDFGAFGLRGDYAAVMEYIEDCFDSSLL